ncbi:hypothetical protein [Streptomyces siamensis]|uniref:Uncharacterized protein n=1 Tax=Streptomyces siamensis TaxID=1274986 RepID=A0ABP9J267_9ACTN
MHLSRSPRRAVAAWAAAALTAAALMTGLPRAAADSSPPAESPKVDSALRDAVANGREASFFVVLKAQADLSAARAKHTHEARTTAAFKELRAKATDSQRSLTAYLDKKKVGHKDFWTADAVHVTGDTPRRTSRRSPAAVEVRNRPMTSQGGGCLRTVRVPGGHPHRAEGGARPTAPRRIPSDGEPLQQRREIRAGRQRSEGEAPVPGET